MTTSVKFGIVASCQHPQIDLTKVNYSKTPYASGPWNTINYCECHDNNTLWDKLRLSNPSVTDATLKNMHLLALTIVLTSQGIPFLHAGTEMLRSKQGVENSYNAGDSINAINWDLKKEHLDIFEYIKSLIRLRKSHPAFRMANAAQIANYIRFEEQANGSTIAYTIDAGHVGDTWKSIHIILNGESNDKIILLPEGDWKTAMNDYSFDPNHKICSGSVKVKGNSAVILYQD